MVELARQVFGEGEPLVIVHGLFGSGRNWQAIAKRLAAERQVITVDMRNHGDSPRTGSHGYEDMAGDLAEVLEQSGPADVLGHSMGGKAAMVLALQRPDLVRRLIVADIAPVSYGHSQMALIDAMQGLDLAAMTRRADADRALEAKVAEPAVRAFLLQSVKFESGQANWLLNLDTLKRDHDKVLSFPDISGQYDGPVLAVTGENSDYVTEAGRAAFAALFPAVEFAEVPRAGHWVHAENPAGFLAAVEGWLDR